MSEQTGGRRKRPIPSSASTPAPTDEAQIGSYVVWFVGGELWMAEASAPEQVMVRLDMEAALELADWLALWRGRLFQTVMREGLEAFKARVRAEYHLPEPEEVEERVIYAPPSSCDEALIALAKAGGVTLCCDDCQQPLCMECCCCHNRRCRQYCQQEQSHVSAPGGE